MLPLTVQSRYLQRRSVSHKEYTLRNEGGDTQSHWVGSPEFRFAFSISHFSAEIFPCTDCSCKRLPDFRMLLYASLKKKNIYIYIYIYNTKHPIINHYIATSISVYCIGSYGPASRLLSPLEKPPTTYAWYCKCDIRSSVNSVSATRLPKSNRMSYSATS